jgi:hypothetical protein
VGLRDLLSGEVLTREGVLANVPYLLFLTSLFVAYVALGYQFERIEREKQRTLRRVRELNAEFKSLEAAFETQLQQSQVESQVAPLGRGPCAVGSGSSCSASSGPPSWGGCW